jgi:F-type H+-transporting ATPase subunit gamma
MTDFKGMAINTKAIKTRIQSVTNTKKITKAMEMVSAAKMRKSVESALNTRTYAVMARDLMEHLAHLEKKPHYDLLEMRPVKNLLVILISSNRGLCGSFNSNILKKTAFSIKNKEVLAKHIEIDGKEILPEEDINVHVIGVGKKSADFAKKQECNLVAVFENLTESRSFDEIIPISKMVIDEFKKGIYDKVVVAYTDYKSSLTQEPKIRQLLPVSKQDIDEMLEELGKNEDSKKEEVKDDIKDEMYSMDNYIFEPSEEGIVEYVLPRLVEIQLYQSILESSASEHSARMLAMRNASDSANDMINELNLTFNKARQAAITQEIAEIAGGAAALE